MKSIITKLLKDNGINKISYSRNRVKSGSSYTGMKDQWQLNDEGFNIKKVSGSLTITISETLENSNKRNYPIKEKIISILTKNKISFIDNFKEIIIK